MSENIKNKEEMITKLFEAGAHFAYSKSRRHPSVSPYIFGVKDNVEIFDLEKTVDLLDSAKGFVAQLAREEKQILFVGGKHESLGIIKEVAESLDMPFVAGRWIGGTLTNFGEVRGRVNKLNDLSEKKEKGLLGGYTKKERLLIDREIEKLEKKFGGLDPMKKLPSAMFVIDSGREEIAVAEAILLGIPVISISGSDCNIQTINYPIVSNDVSIRNLELLTNEIGASYKEGKENKEEKKEA